MISIYTLHVSSINTMSFTKTKIAYKTLNLLQNSFIKMRYLSIVTIMIILLLNLDY